MRKSIDIKKLEKALPPNCSNEIKLGYLYLYLNSDEAGVIDYKEHEHSLLKFAGLRLSLWPSTLFPRMEHMLTFHKNLIIVNHFVEWNYGKLKSNYNPHSKAFKVIEKRGLKYNQETNRIEHN